MLESKEDQILVLLIQREYILALLTVFIVKRMSFGRIRTASGTLTSIMVQEYPMKSSLIFTEIKSSGQLVLNLPAHSTLLSFAVALK
jgi:hypothetical protein